MARKTNYFNYFGEIEQAPLSAITRWRDMILSWPVRALDHAGVRPNQVTFLSFTIQIIFFPWFFAREKWVPALIVVLTHVLLDCLDGSLARVQGTASRGGALLDMFNDITGMAIVALTVIFLGRETAPGLTALYVVLYLYLTFFTIFLNVMGRPFAIIIRTKYFFFGLVFLKYWLNVDFLEPFLVICSLYMALHAMLSMNRLVDCLNEEDNAGGEGEAAEPEKPGESPLKSDWLK
ncbi:MAG: CDP-alcohol phosphatidyltransferase family protein [Proteobacteria bacterium]|nr:CDP-alcohol phosphatidyltransferase family protein [Pseudomonadota bacterium]